MMIKSFLLASSLAVSLAVIPSPTPASPYSPVLQVNESVITEFELKQRVSLLRAFGTTGDLNQLAREQLIGDRLRSQAAKDAGITVGEDQIASGMEEFAARGNFTAEQLLAYLRQRGVDAESFKAFVKSGVAWRAVVRAKFASKVNVSDAEIDARLETVDVDFPKTVSIAEILLPMDIRGPAQTRSLADRLVNSINSQTEFAQAAQKYSKAANSQRGGARGFAPLSVLPPQVASRVAALEVGQITSPITLGDSIAIYQLLGVREAKSANELVLAVSYLDIAVPSDKTGRDSQAAFARKIINSADTCLDMQAVTAKFGENAVVSQSLAVADVPARISGEIASLDPNEATYYTNEKGGINILMLCNRAKDLPDGARDQIRNALLGQRIGGFGEGYLQELRGDAIIIER